MVRDDDGAHASTLTGTGYGTEVAHVGHAVKHDDKRILTLIKKLGHHVLKTVIGDGCHHGKHALVVAAGDSVDLLNRYSLYRHS